MHLRFASLRPLGLMALAPIVMLLSTNVAEAARVTKVKGDQVLIDGEGEELSTNQKYFIVIDGKRRGVVEITQVKGGKARGRVTKGKAAVDASVEAPSSGGGGSKQAGGKRKKSMVPGLYIGGLLGYSMDSQSIKFAGGQAISMSGSGFSGKAFGDLPISGPLGVIARFGIEQFNVKASSGGVSSETAIMYVTGDLLLRYNFMEGDLVPFAMGGLGLYFPMSKSSTNALDSSRISAVTIGLIGGGVNYNMSRDMYLTAVAEYGYFPPSNDVSTSLIAVRGGAGWRF